MTEAVISSIRLSPNITVLSQSAESSYYSDVKFVEFLNGHLLTYV